MTIRTLTTLSTVAALVLASHGHAQTIDSVEIPLPHGEPALAHLAGPEDADAAIVIVHDWFGVTDFTRETMHRLASDGFRVLAVDLYGGEAAATHDRAGELLGALEPERVDATLRAAIERLSANDRPVAVMGFSAGGAPAFRVSLAESDRVAATVVVYGGGIEAHPADALSRLQGDLLVATGSRDSWALDSALALLPQLEAAGRSMELYVYPGARHAFAQPLFNGGENYDETATRATWAVIDDFLSRALRPPS